MAVYVPVVSLPVVGANERFPVRRIHCVGRNYPSLNARQGYTPEAAPHFFAKHRDCLVQSGSTVRYPPLTKHYEHEIELVVAMKSGGAKIARAEAAGHVFGYAAGLDMTRRDLLNEARMNNLSWEIGKSFDESAPIGAIHPASEVGHPASGAISLAVNGKMRQNDYLSSMIWKVPDIVFYLSQQVGLDAGDLIFTGTPGGASPVFSGDPIVGHIDRLSDITITVG